MADNTILSTIDQRGVATLTLNRAEQHNAFDDVMIAELIHILQKLDNDPKVRLLQLTATGKSFSAGADLNWMRRMANYTETENYQDALQLSELMQTLDQFSKPTIAIVQGAVFGGGVGLVACCDIAIAAPEASFCLSEVKLGLIPAAISPYVIAKIGQSAARRYFLSAEIFTASEAQRLNLIHDIVTADLLEATAEKFCTRLLKNSPAALTAAKKLISEVAHQAISNQLREKTAKEIARLRVSPEGQEGLTAFFEKRAPHWV